MTHADDERRLNIRTTFMGTEAEHEHYRKTGTYPGEIGLTPAASGSADVQAVRAVMRLLAAIADAYDANELDDEARKFHGRNDEHFDARDPATIELYSGRGGNRLLTLQNCLDARSAIPALDAIEVELGRLREEDACRLSRVFNEGANLAVAQDYRINEWLKKLIVGSKGAASAQS
jgi:hypothetical protein